MIRTQIYLTEDEKEELQQLSERTGRSQSELIRAAIDAFLEERDEATRRECLDAPRGMWEGRDDLPDFETLRDEFDRES